ncbi:MAG: TRAP transporter substrate-binding protein DctP [Desulfobacteraceae bacterium]|nr:TRAP transporter substrate-binding protein DctP [Desulfobacteraceae bacterium]
MRKVFLIFIGIMFTLSLIPLSNGPVQAAGGEPINLIYSSFIHEKCPQEQVDIWYMKELEKRTKGKVKFKSYFSGSLTKGLETLPAVRSGAVHLSAIALGYHPAEFPYGGLFNIIHIPRQWKKAIDAGYELLWNSGAVSDMLHEEARKQNFKYLYCQPVWYRLLSKPRISSLADIKGLKMRTTGIYEPKHAALFDATPKNVLAGEWYEALSRGTIDCINVAWGMMADYKLHEIAKHLSFSDGAIVARLMGINIDTFEKLPPGVQDLMVGMREEVHHKTFEVYGKKLDEVDRIFKDAGGEYVKVDPKEQDRYSDSWIEVTLHHWLPNMEALGKKKEATLILDRWLELTTGKGYNFWNKKYPRK